MIEDLEKDLKQMDTEQVEKKLLEERRSMVEFAEKHGQWQLFDDKQSIESMRESINRMDNSELKHEIMKRFNRVESLYDEYTKRIVEDSLD